MLRYTDDTEMALAIYETLDRLRTIDEDALVYAFVQRFNKDPDRGYGKMARRILREVSQGADWRKVSSEAFGGGSFGNGAAMRVAPLGAYYADAMDEIEEMASRSARVTHFHPEGIAGAVSTAFATAAAVSSRGESPLDAAAEIWRCVLERTPDSRTRENLQRAHEMGDASAEQVAREVGNGFEISAQDTVPFCVWNACRCLSDFSEALISTVEIGGDCDTNCAIVGGIVSGFTGPGGIPEEWLRVRERLQPPSS